MTTPTVPDVARPEHTNAGRASHEAIAQIVGLTSPQNRPVNGALPVATVAARSPTANPLALGNLPGRDLDPEELRELAAGIAADPGQWSEHVAFSDDERHYVSLYRDTHVDIWVLCWTPQNDTGWHDHDISSGAVAVTRGRLVEHNLSIDGRALQSEIGEGKGKSFGPEHIHRLTGLAAGSVSIHAYSPPLWRMGQYSVVGGMLRRKSVSYADELRPIDDMA